MTTATTTQCSLVKGVYTAEEAREILLNLLHSKINFHECKILGDELRFGTKNQASIDRVAQLRISKKEALAAIEHAEATGKRMVITSTIDISFEA